MSYIQILRDKREDVLRQLDQLRHQVAELTTQLGVRENQLKNIDDLLALEGEHTPHTVEEDVKLASSGARRLVDHAHEMLEQARQPIHYRELARRLGENGVYIPGQDPAANLLTQITRDPRFSRASGRGIYGLADWPSVAAARRRRRSTAAKRERKA